MTLVTMQSWIAHLGKFYTPLLIITACIIVQFLFRSLWTCFRGPLYGIPGPLKARWTNFWMVKQTLDGNQHLVWHELHQKHGPIIRIGPKTVLIADLDAFRTVFGPGTVFPKAEEYEAFDLLPGVPNIFGVRDSQVHSKMRKRVGAAYAGPSILRLEARVDQKLVELTQAIGAFADEEKEIDMALWITFLTFDVLGEIGFSRTFNFLNMGCDTNGVIHAVQVTTPYLIAFSHVPKLVKAVRSRFFRRFFGQPRGVSFLDGLVRTIVQQRSSLPKYLGRERDMLDYIVHARNDDGSRLTEDEIFVEAEIIFYAGADTIAASIKAVIYFVTTHPHVLQKLQVEIDAFTADGALSNPPLFRETSKMLYLLAVLKETRRIFPAASAKFMRSTPKGGAYIAGTYVPEGFDVGCSPWTIHRNKEIFGGDADEFRPERWIGDPERVKLMNKYDFDFGMGARECAGKHVALLQIQKIIPQLFRKFEFKLSDMKFPWKAQNYGIVFQRDMKMHVSYRK